MKINYTQIAENSIPKFSAPYQLEEALDFLNDSDNFREFHEGLSQLLYKTGYTGPSDTTSKTNYLYDKLQLIGSTIEKKTVDAWISGTQRPKIEASSRQKMYEICFALQVNLSDAFWFFNHVYYDRGFNYHSIEEAVFYFFLKNNFSYSEALSTIAIIKEATPANSASNIGAEHYTKFLHDSLQRLSTKEDFVKFMILHKENFNGWNKTAFLTINHFLEKLTGSNKTTSSDIDSIRKYLKKPYSFGLHSAPFKASIFDNCGLLLREIAFDAMQQYKDRYDIAEAILERIGSKHVFRSTFVLEQLLYTSQGLKKEANVPYVIRVNFPSKKLFSDVLSQKDSGAYKIESYKSYDTVRKILVLLHFFVFWLQIKLGDTSIASLEKTLLTEIYRDDINSFLTECGYDELFPGNPFDWLFLTASSNESPITFFRDCMAEITDTYDW